MPQEADFCGGQLRLSAFLRVVGDGMPRRPTRFKRRLPAVDSALDAPIDISTDSTVTSVHSAVHKELSKDISLFDIAHSPVPEQLSLEGRSRGIAFNSGCLRDCDRPDDGPLSTSQQQAKRQIFNTTKRRSITEPCKTSSARKGRRLPVNELALLRTTASDGLPQPSVRHRLAR